MTRRRPAAFSAAANGASRMPLVVIARSRTRGVARELRDSVGRLVRSSGSPPVMPQLVDAQADEHADQPVDLLEGQHVVLRQPGVLGLGHAGTGTAGCSGR